MHKLGLSLFSAGKMLPVRYAPLELELNLVNVATDWLKTGNNGAGTTYSTNLLPGFVLYRVEHQFE